MSAANPLWSARMLTIREYSRLMIRLLAWLLGCRHARLTWPQTREGRTTRCCLACGKELEYRAEWLTPEPGR